MIESKAVKTESVELISDRGVGESIRMVRIHRKFDQAFGLITVVMIKRPDGWKINGLGVDISGSLTDFLNKLKDGDARVVKELPN